MAAFIIISTDNRLHYLVDGIMECRPLNPTVSVSISTGKIVQSESEYIYKYTIEGENNESKEEQPFGKLVANQLAQFRSAHSISPGIVNIFFLENPSTQEESERNKEWLTEIESVYAKHDKSFCVYRILFTYNHERPTDVCDQIDFAVLNDLLKEHRDVANCKSSSFDKFLFYIDNQKSDAAALCQKREEHNLKMPRFLLDFMMLVSNNNDAYGVRSAITSPNCLSKCFSVGFAESMYYYPDVERYYIHADLRDTYAHILTTVDEKVDEQGKEAMNIEKYPFGLRSRMERLKKIYESVPYSENIDDYPESMDKHIDDCIKTLKDMLMVKREAEIEEVDGKEPDCPEYIDRSAIYEELNAATLEQREEIESRLSEQYEKLVAFSKTKAFMDFVQEQECTISADSELPPNTANIEQSAPSRVGCLGRLMFWKKQNSSKDVPPPITPPTTEAKLTEYIKNIRKWLEHKDCYKKFYYEIANIEEKYQNEKKYCEEFVLTTHTNHYFPLIHKEKLKQAQQDSFPYRLEKHISEWRKKPQQTLANLVGLTKEASKKYTKESFAFIDWESPMSFVQDLSSSDAMADICNQLQKKSSPLVNYSQISEFHEDKVTRILYSDRPCFESEDFPAMRPKLDNGNTVSARYSTHIVSKICMMQFLPMDESILDGLTDLKEM